MSLTLWDVENGYDMLVVNADGAVAYHESISPLIELGKLFYVERTGDVTVIAIPLDHDYRVDWKAEKNGTVECIQANATVLVSSGYPGVKSGKIQVSAGDTGVAFQSENHEAVALEGFSDTVFNARELAEFMGIASLGFNWRIALTALCALAALIISVILCLIAAFRPTRQNRYSFLVWALLCVLGIAAAETEAAFWFFADQPWVRIAWKCVVALCLLLLFLKIHRGEGKLLQSFFPSILLAVIADVVISFHSIAGVALFLLCHAMLSYQFLRRSPMPLGKWILWAVVSAVAEAVIILFYVPSRGAAAWAVAAYVPVLLLMAFSCGKQPVRVRLSAILFLSSDLLLGMYITVLEEPMIHVLYMFLFYLSLLLLTLSASRASDAPEARIQ